MLLRLLLLAPLALTSPLSTSPSCTKTSTTTYRDDWGPILYETRYTCATTPLSPSIPLAGQKPTLTAATCGLLPDPLPLPSRRYSNLFWALRQLDNQTCLDPGEVVEWSDIEHPWTSDWRLTVVRGGGGAGKWCEWHAEIANMGEAVHGVCVHQVGVGEESGGLEALGAAGIMGDGGDVGRVCLRYSERGWGEGWWGERCVGTAGEGATEGVEQEL